jgi:hypothetical protein
MSMSTKALLIASAAGMVGVVIGFLLGNHALPACQGPERRAEEARNPRSQTKIEASAPIEHAECSYTANIEGALPPRTSPNIASPAKVETTTSPAHEMSDEELDQAFDNLRKEQVSAARERFAAEAHLSSDQSAALDRIAGELDQALDAPLQVLRTQDGAKSREPLDDRMDATIAALNAVKLAEREFRALLSPQQRSVLAQTEFQVSSQVAGDHLFGLEMLGVIELDVPANFPESLRGP